MRPAGETDIDQSEIMQQPLADKPEKIEAELCIGRPRGLFDQTSDYSILAGARGIAGWHPALPNRSARHYCCDHCSSC
jgi:hypothetical protein